MTFWTWSLTDSLLETVTPSIFSDDTRAMSGSGGGVDAALRIRLLLVNTISTHFARFKCRLFERAHASTLANSAALLWTLAAGMMMYVSSAYLQCVSRGDGAEVGGSDDVGRRSDG